MRPVLGLRHPGPGLAALRLHRRAVLCRDAAGPRRRHHGAGPAGALRRRPDVPPLHTAMTDGAVFWMYGGICLLGAFFALLFVPETKDKSLEEIEFKFGHKKNLHVTPLASPMQQRRNQQNRAHPLQSIQFTL